MSSSPESDRGKEPSEPVSAELPVKKPYQTPVLTVHGTVDQITLSGPGRRAEAGSGHSHP
jgi:hypothetical protein